MPFELILCDPFCKESTGRGRKQMCALEHLGVKREGLLCTSDAETIPSIKK